MGVAKRYYLVIRDRESNEYNIINIRDRNGNSHRANKLEVIDDLTTNYEDRYEFINDLLEQKYINNANVDLFIVSPNNKGDYLDYYELVFGSNYKIDGKLKKIIDASLDRNIIKEGDNIKYILDRFAELMCYDDEFNNIVMFKYSNVANKYVNYFKGRRGLKPFYQAKFKDGEWALNSYSLIRNIVDILDRFKQYKNTNKEMFEENLSYYKRNTPGRRHISNYLFEDIHDIYFNGEQEDRLELKGDLLRKTDKHFIEGQLSFDDYLLSLEFDDEVIDNINNDEINVDFDTKIAVVMDVFRKLPKKTFSVLEDKSIIFNTNMFLIYKNENDKNILSTLIPGDLLKDIDRLIVNQSKLRMYSSRIYETENLSKEVEHYSSKIYNRLSNNIDELNNAYSWCLLYNKCMDDDIEYRRKLGEDNGKQYDKYGEFKNEGN